MDTPPPPQDAGPTLVETHDLNGWTEMRDALLRRFEDVQDDLTRGGWTARCSACPPRRRQRFFIDRSLKIDWCPNGHGAAEIMAAAAPREVGANDGDPPPPEPFCIPVAQLLELDLPAPEWIIPGYLQEENIGILAGPPGAGKTLQAFAWCAALVANNKHVFIAENEGSLAALQSRLRRSCAAAGIPIPPERYTYRRNLAMSLANFKQVRAVAKQLEYYDMIVLDSLSSFWPGLDENKPEHMSMVAEALKLLSENSGAAVLGVHHTTKAAWKPGERPSLADIRGHGAMAGRIDAAFICKPLPNPAGVVRYELYVVKQRDGGWAEPKAVEVLMTGSEATVTMEPLGDGRWPDPKEQKRNAELDQAIFAVLPETAEQAISQNEVCTRTRKSKTDVIAAVKRLFRQQRINQDWVGKYYRMKATPSDSGGNGLRGHGRFGPYQPPESED